VSVKVDPMNVVEAGILQTLKDLDLAVAQIRAGTKADLLPLFSKLEKLTSELPRGTDPQLLHYLHKKSYEKARLHLEGRDAENARGSC